MYLGAFEQVFSSICRFSRDRAQDQPGRMAHLVETTDAYMLNVRFKPSRTKSNPVLLGLHVLALRATIGQMIWPLILDWLIHCINRIVLVGFTTAGKEGHSTCAAVLARKYLKSSISNWANWLFLEDFVSIVPYFEKYSIARVTRLFHQWLL